MDLSPSHSWDHALAIGVRVEGGKYLPPPNPDVLEPKRRTNTRRAAMLQAHHIPHTTPTGVQGIVSHVWYLSVEGSS